MPPFLILAALFAQAPPPVEAAAPPAVGAYSDAPDWLRRPSQAEKLAAYPRAALARRIAGQVSIACTLDANGYLRTCRVVDEAPAGYGFGEAALSLAPAFRMTPLTPRGASVDGARVTIPIAFAPAATRSNFRLR